ncbi:MAG: hypothetical protein HWE18_00600 [Gammaproteobacteria bacterium]|nr:hypothetical protein [Gammaproteobacteria bacterium]
MARNAYKQALEQAEQTQPIDKKIISKIQREAAVYRRQQLKRVQTLLIQKQWAEAQTLLIQLTESQPHHKQFDRVHKQLTRLRNEEALQIASEQCLAEVALLKIKIQQSQYDKRNDTSTFSWWNQDDWQREKQKLTEQLMELSTQAIAYEKYDLAKKTFEQALTLDSEIKNQNISRSIYQGLKQNNAATIAQRQNRLVSQLATAIEDENFEQIIKIKAILSNPPFKGSKVSRLLKSANRLLTENALELDQQGDSVYRQGNIQTAIELWQQAKILAPDLSGLQDKLSRAQKVQNKLNALRQSQQSSPE